MDPELVASVAPSRLHCSRSFHFKSKSHRTSPKDIAHSLTRANAMALLSHPRKCLLRSLL